ncbi:MAG: aldehyde dehydrogenase family protein [Verrucomicrobiae bacterium]|nr:aldehyde dehydrogenase family protein [Verrucomicrobiae bacterium]
MAIAVKGLLIGKEWVSSPNSYSLRNPYSGEEITKIPTATEELLEHGIQKAHETFDIVRKQSAAERSDLLRSIAAELEKRRNDFIEALIVEAGKPVTFAEVEASRAVMTFTIAAEEARHQEGHLLDIDALPPGKDHFGLIKRFPIGVIAGITPFNFPLNLVAHKVAPCLATGNTMLLKPAAKTPLCSLLLGEVLLKAGMTPGQVNIMPCSNELAGKLISDERIKKISFTGSPEVGWRLKAGCGRKKITLELGGNAGVIVHDDANWESAIPLIATGGFSYAGQSCISVQRILVQESIFESFKEKFVNQVKNKIKTGDPRQRDVTVGPMIDEGSLKRIDNWVQEAVKEGAKVLVGGKVNGNCFEATVLDGVKASMKVCAQEVFAPVVTLQSYGTYDEALQIVNDSRYGLQAGVFTNDIKRAMQAFAELEVGGVLINQVPTFRVENMPYGGVKDSGFGREGLRYAMEEMTEMKALIFNLK